MKNLIQIFLVLLLCLGTTTLYARERAKVIPLEGIDYETVEALCRPLLNDKGTIAHLKDRRAFLVYDDEKVIDKIIKVVASVSKKLPNIRVKVEFLGNTQIKESGASVDSSDPWQIKIEDGKVKLPKVDGVNVKINKTNLVNNNTMLLTARSSHPASLWVGREEPHYHVVEEYFFRPGVVLSHKGRVYLWKKIEIELRKVGSQLMMKATAAENGEIDVEIYPVVTFYAKKGGKKTLKVESLSTTVTLKPGQRLSIGGVVGSKIKDYKNLFGPDFYGSKTSNSMLDMYISAEILK